MQITYKEYYNDVTIDSRLFFLGLAIGFHDLTPTNDNHFTKLIR